MPSKKKKQQHKQQDVEGYIYEFHPHSYLQQHSIELLPGVNKKTRFRKVLVLDYLPDDKSHVRIMSIVRGEIPNNCLPIAPTKKAHYDIQLRIIPAPFSYQEANENCHKDFLANIGIPAYLRTDQIFKVPLSALKPVAASNGQPLRLLRSKQGSIAELRHWLSCRRNVVRTDAAGKLEPVRPQSSTGSAEIIAPVLVEALVREETYGMSGASDTDMTLNPRRIREHVDEQQNFLRQYFEQLMLERYGGQTALAAPVPDDVAFGGTEETMVNETGASVKSDSVSCGGEVRQDDDEGLGEEGEEVEMESEEEVIGKENDYHGCVDVDEYEDDDDDVNGGVSLLAELMAVR